MYNAVLLPHVRYHQQLSCEAKVIFAEMTACVDENQMMDYVPAYFEHQLNLSPALVNKALGELKNYGLIKYADNEQIWVNL